MKAPHFFKAYSRLGVINPPLGSRYPNLGVERAPDVILAPQFLGSFSNSQTSSYLFPLPEDVSQTQLNRVLASNLNRFKRQLSNQVKPRQIQVVVGGDHSVTFASLAAVLERASNPAEVGYIHFDSHADCNTFTESPTKNFHGMFLRPLIDSFDLPQINQIVKAKVPTKNIVLIGNLRLDPGESRFLKGAAIKNITRVDLVTNWSQSVKWLRSFKSCFKHLHISLDIDVFDRSVAMATGTPSASGCFPEEIFPILELLSKHPSWSMDLVEVNPDKEQNLHTVSLAQQILRRMFK